MRAYARYCTCSFDSVKITLSACTDLNPILLACVSESGLKCFAWGS